MFPTHKHTQHATHHLNDDDENNSKQSLFIVLVSVVSKSLCGVCEWVQNNKTKSRESMTTAERGVGVLLEEELSGVTAAGDVLYSGSSMGPQAAA